jgi:cytochrome P450
MIPPTPPHDPIIGHLRHIRRESFEFYLRVFRDYGDVVRMLFGRTPMYLLAHPDHVKYVLQENPKNFEKRSPGYTKMRTLFGNGLVTSDGEEWRKQRRIAQPAFHRERINVLGEVMTRATADMLEAWSKREGTIIDVSPEMMRVTQRIVAETLLGTEAPADADAVGDAVAWCLEDLVRRQTSPIDLPLNVPTPKNRRFLAQMKLVEDVVYRAIRERRAAKGERRDLLGMIMDARDDEGGGEGLDDRELRDQIFTIFVAGHETTANGLVWTLYLLSLYPAWRRAAREEVRSVLAGRTPTMADVPKLPLLDRILKESMRLKPPITRVGRRIASDVTIGGYRMLAGEYLVIAPYVTHRHPEFWPNPEAFDPDRFLPEREAERPRYAYFPFLGGPRQCIGNVFATVEAILILAMILGRYDLDLVPGHPVVHADAFSLRQKYGMRMFLRRV